jgi:hypothetical protein
MVDGAVTLLNDIDASSIKEWIPVGTKDNPFRENFDGKGFAIKNVSWTVDTDKYPDAGFFGYAKNSMISNLVFGSEGSVVTFKGNASGTIGGIVGNAVGVTLVGVTNKADLNVSAGSFSLCMGGICGKTDGVSLLGDQESKKKGCVNDGDISASFACLNAGLVGHNAGKIFSCTNNGAVTGVASNGVGPAWGCAYNTSADRFIGNFGYGSVNGRSSVHSTAVYPASAYNLEENTVDWTQDDYYDWDVLEEKQLHAGVKYSHCSFKDGSQAHPASSANRGEAAPENTSPKEISAPLSFRERSLSPRAETVWKGRYIHGFLDSYSYIHILHLPPGNVQ